MTKRIAFGWKAGGPASALAIALLVAGPATAEEGGMSPYLKGFAGFMYGYIPPQGGLVAPTAVYYHFDGDAGADVRNGRIETDLHISLDGIFAGGSYITDWHILGGQFAVGAVVDYPIIGLDANITGPLGNTIHASPSAEGFGDMLIQPVILGWHSGNWHWMFTTLIMAPTGHYDRTELSVSRNQWGFMPQVALTWFDPKSGWEATGALTYVTTTKNDATDYQSGDVLHLDWALGLHLSEAWELGIQGNVVQQVTGDTGSGAVLGSLKARSWGFGPAVTFNGKIGKVPVNLSGKWEHDFDADKTFKGDVVMLSFTAVL